MVPKKLRYSPSRIEKVGSGAMKNANCSDSNTYVFQEERKGAKNEQTLRITPQDLLYPTPLHPYFDQPTAPLEIDVGCGKGRFLLARAASYPEVNFLGIERMLKRIRKVDKKACSHGLQNIRLLRMDAYYAIVYLIPPAQVRTYYIFFPDPWPKKKHSQHRLFSPEFVKALADTLTPHGCVHVFTDHEPYYEQIKHYMLSETRFFPQESFMPKAEEKTDFEILFSSHKTICRCSFQKKSSYTTHPNYSV